MKSATRVGSVIPYVLAAAIGALLAGLSPKGLLLPLFFGCIAAIGVLTVAAHRASTSASWGLGKWFIVILAPFGGPAGIEIKGGPAPRALIMAILFSVSFVAVLAVSTRAA